MTRRTAYTALAVAGIALSAAACSTASGAMPAAGVATSPAGAATAPAGAVTSRAGAVVLQGSYVALGDSYTAGPDIPAQTGATAGCDQSTSSYPYLVAQRLRLNLTDMSCSGATIADLSGAQLTGDGSNPAQLSPLSTATRLVTLGIGGNDIGWSAIITRCTELDLVPVLIPGEAAAGSTPCQDYYTSGGADRIRQKIQAAAGLLAGALTQVRHRAPDARVYLVGYPDLLPAGGGTCGHTLGVTQGDVAFLNDEALQLNSALRQAAQAAGTTYVDTYGPSVGHDACSDPASRWIEPLLPASPAAPLHPNAAGEQGMADAVTRAVTGNG
ncbi:SGNH/GDSL hydrolase family protein [Trebonia kvetii]|uniref:SGNH/GDSL hydrolase family protein n=2 Tax=Trebonia kvetii TaxID=2480626 RepID=A0A6P2C047_9ACTN|nr:SGNH/GDSL hydrolase family protein [Trebonia kvetii]